MVIHQTLEYELILLEHLQFSASTLLITHRPVAPNKHNLLILTIGLDQTLFLQLPFLRLPLFNKSSDFLFQILQQPLGTTRSLEFGSKILRHLGHDSFITCLRHLGSFGLLLPMLAETSVLGVPKRREEVRHALHRMRGTDFPIVGQRRLRVWVAQQPVVLPSSTLPASFFALQQSLAAFQAVSSERFASLMTVSCSRSGGFSLIRGIVERDVEFDGRAADGSRGSW